MKLDANKLALSFGGATAILWTLCSLFVALVPGAMMSMTGHMLHTDVSGFAWIMTGTGFLVGLICWTAWAMAAGWLIGWLYSLLGGAASS
jgi:hypothetical protein